jgi:excisionase family DNA binding protein
MKKAVVEQAYFTPAEVCTYTTLSLRTVRRLLAQAVDPIPSIKVGASVLVPIAKLDEWLERHEVSPRRDATAATVDAFMAEIGRG